MHQSWRISLLLGFLGLGQIVRAVLPRATDAPAGSHIGEFKSTDDACKAIYSDQPQYKVESQAASKDAYNMVGFECREVPDKPPTGSIPQSILGYGTWFMSCAKGSEPRIYALYSNRIYPYTVAVCEGPEAKDPAQETSVEVASGSTECVNSGPFKPGQAKQAWVTIKGGTKQEIQKWMQDRTRRQTRLTFFDLSVSPAEQDFESVMGKSLTLIQPREISGHTYRACATVPPGSRNILLKLMSVPMLAL